MTFVEDAPAGITISDPTLNDVKNIIPPVAYKRSKKKSYAYVARDVALYVAVCVALFLTNTWWMLIPLWIIAGLVVSGLFVIGHDAAHLALFDSPKTCSRVGHLLLLPSLHNYKAWVFGHNRVHHGFTVQQNRDFVWHPLTVEQYQDLSRIHKLRHRLEWSWMGSGLYYLREVWWNKMIRFKPPVKWKKAIRRDNYALLAFVFTMYAGLTAISLAAGGTVATGAWQFAKIVIVPWLLFIGVIGWTVHVHHIGPEIEWYKKADWKQFNAQVSSTTVYQIPKWANFFFHNIFIHIPHHVDSRIPFYELPEAYAAIRKNFPESVKEAKLTLPAYFRATKTCKLYDFDKRQWLPYPS